MRPIGAVSYTHLDCAFLCFTNATLIDEAFCQEMIRVGNFVPAISAEGDEGTTDVYKRQEQVAPTIAPRRGGSAIIDLHHRERGQVHEQLPRDRYVDVMDWLVNLDVYKRQVWMGVV